MAANRTAVTLGSVPCSAERVQVLLLGGMESDARQRGMPPLIVDRIEDSVVFVSFFFLALLKHANKSKMK